MSTNLKSKHEILAHFKRGPIYGSANIWKSRVRHTDSGFSELKIAARPWQNANNDRKSLTFCLGSCAGAVVHQRQLQMFQRRLIFLSDFKHQT